MAGDMYGEILKRKTAVIMQPTYMPWLGYFDLIDQSDIFVILDSVQFDRRSWQQRNRIKNSTGTQWMTVPVVSKGKRSQKINEVMINKTQDFPRSHIKSVKHLYSRARYYDRYYKEYGMILNRKHDFLAGLNIDLIIWFTGCLGIEKKIIRSSSLKARGGKVELLVSICKEVGADGYLSTIGARDYINDNDVFRKNGIELAYHNYFHPEYCQLYSRFVAYLSVLDLLLNEGGKSLEIIRSGRRTPVTEA